MVKSQTKPKMSLFSWIFRMIVAIIWDGLDFLIGWTPGFGDIKDFIGIFVNYALWGPVGLIYIWEFVVFGPGNVADAFVPTSTMLGLYALGSGQVDINIKKKRKKNGKRKR